MKHLKKKQYEMTEEQEILVARLCSFQEELHCKREYIIRCGNKDNDIFDELVYIEEELLDCGLPKLDVTGRLCTVNYMEGLIHEYGKDVPKDHNSKEYQEWYDINYHKISKELEDIENIIEQYINDIEKKSGTLFH